MLLEGALPVEGALLVALEEPVLLSGRLLVTEDSPPWELWLVKCAELLVILVLMEAVWPVVVAENVVSPCLERVVPPDEWIAVNPDDPPPWPVLIEVAAVLLLLVPVDSTWLLVGWLVTELLFIAGVIPPVILISIALLWALLVVALVELTLLEVWLFADAVLIVDKKFWVVPLLGADVVSCWAVPVLMLVGNDELTVVPEKRNTPSRSVQSNDASRIPVCLTYPHSSTWVEY
jgi:hypothetical protein